MFLKGNVILYFTRTTYRVSIPIILMNLKIVIRISLFRAPIVNFTHNIISIQVSKYYFFHSSLKRPIIISSVYNLFKNIKRCN